MTRRETEAKIAADLSHAGYRGLFLAGDHSMESSIWHDGENCAALMGVALGECYSDLERVLASEVLFANNAGYPPRGWEDLLGSIYARALAITGTGDRPILLTGNEWGLLYRDGDGTLATHLLSAGRAAVRHLVPLLDDPATIFYEGSQDAMVGGGLNYRVKDAAAYFIGRLTGLPMSFHEPIAERDAEIEHLRAAVAGSR